MSLPTLMPTAFPTAAPPSSSGLESFGSIEPAPPADSGWQAGDTGLELRRLLTVVPSSGTQAPLLVLRLDLSRVQVRIGYAPGQPRPLREWYDEREALAVINGGFFTPEYTALGLTISGGATQGSSREGGGMFAVDAAGVASIRDLAQEPYADGEPLVEALQSFPMLVRPGGMPGQIEENGERARRSAVALDNQGRVLLIVAPTSDWTLQDLADTLASGDLQIERALNLDGGSSSGIIVRSGPLEEQVLPFTTLPQVLLIERKP